MVLSRVDSTNAFAWRLAADSAPSESPAPIAPTAVVAWEQSRGRGRLGRRWASAAGGGVWASLLVPRTAPDRAARLPLVAAAALCRAVDRHVAAGCRLKWPNDLLVSGKKIGGLLVETVSTGGGPPRAAVLGLGVNYRAPAASAGAATGLQAESAEPPELAALAIELLEAVVDALPLADDAAEAVEGYRRLSVHRPGEALRCRVGERLVEGSFVGFDPRGFLRLERRGEELLLAAADLVESPSASVPAAADRE